MNREKLKQQAIFHQRIVELQFYHFNRVKLDEKINDKDSKKHKFMQRKAVEKKFQDKMFQKYYKKKLWTFRI